MPLYKYECTSCSLKFEEIVKFDDTKDQACPECGSSSERQFPDSVSVIGAKLDPKRDTIVSPKEIDKVVGADSEKKWEDIEKRKASKEKQQFGFEEEYHANYKARQDKRRNGREPQEIEIPKDADGKYTPLKHLGDEKEKDLRNEYSEALIEHREKREEQGLNQFDSSGDIE